MHSTKITSSASMLIAPPGLAGRRNMVNCKTTGKVDNVQNISKIAITVFEKFNSIQKKIRIKKSTPGECVQTPKCQERNRVDVFNFLQPTLDNTANDMSVAKIVESCRQEKSALGADVLCGASAARVCCALASAAETLFTRVANTTTLPVLRAALVHLTMSSHQLLFTGGWSAAENEARWWRRARGVAGEGRSSAAEAARALCRTGDVALRCLRAARPLAHRMVVWTIVGPHFMQAACHKDIHISSLAIQCMYDSITALLNQQTELPHFHFNEALLKPFENLLCLELCDTDIQEQIISCICEFVETNRMEIRSGWRPLFNTLRVANNSNQYSAILEIFKVFLSTDNTLVFANAALDCILCLLSHIKGLHYEEVQSTEHTNKKVFQTSSSKTPLSNKFVKYNNKFIPLHEEKSERVIINMCKESLYYLESCADILTMMYNMPKCPIFNTGNRIKADVQLAVVDPIISSGVLDITKFISSEDCTEEVISYKKLSTSLPSNYTTGSCLLKLDKQSNILKVWYALIEGLISATVVCSKNNQPAAMETLFKLFRNIIEVPGTHFGLHCINHLLLPMVQNWLRQIANINGYWNSVMPNFKQCCGMTTDTVVLYLHHLQQINAERSNLENKPDQVIDEPIENLEATFALKQIMLILVECIAQPQEPIARLGASCIRHIILTSGHLLTNNQWEIVCTSLHRACNVSLTPLKQLTYAFKENSNSFYGDLAIVKVAARRDCSINDNVRLHAMAQQVFLNDQLRSEQSIKNQSKASSKAGVQNVLIDDRSYIFLIYLQETLNTLNPELFMVRIPHRGLVVGLLAHQILVQIIATVLIQASSDVFHGINNILLDSLKTGSTVANFKFFLNTHNVDLLLKSLELSYRRAMQFDARPGLKFLIQKVSNLDFAANLYKQTTSSWLIKIIALTEYFFGGVERYKLKLSDVIFILNSYTSNLNLSMEYDRFIVKIFDMKQTWEMLCISYISHLPSETIFDHMDHPKADIMSTCSSSEDTDISMPIVENLTPPPSLVADDTSDEVPRNVISPRPFTFADFKKTTAEYPSTTDVNKVVLKDSGLEENDALIDGNETTPNVTQEIKTQPKEITPVKNKSISDDSMEVTRKVNITICDGPTYNNDASVRKTAEPLLPPQPVPPEIEQQRIHSISKDTETRRSCFQNILMAYLELILTFPLERFEVVYPVLQDGFLQLSRVACDPQVLDRVNAFFNRKDMV